jgi:hypothetical protein
MPRLFKKALTTRRAKRANRVSQVHNHRSAPPIAAPV